ncbi:hypothetical protein CH380_19430 [Leptospira adleri]|uniref:GNAT family N-acetyltransferase n=1 Tax=Leptospira adleri TaxID=2023186 RepID=A0A2M9YJC1_9LEPT|nr:hypothetical protein CH380_19430 [Leptospira adleri]PJZ61939.1 hypothetical protein CH376_10735 [Leptospira adleri]
MPVKIVSGDSEDIPRIKAFVNRIFSEAGYSSSRWKNIDYDDWSTWFFAEEEGRILSAMRVVEKQPENFLPLEVAVLDKTLEKPIRYAVLSENVADWNAVAFELSRTGWMAAKKTFRTVAKHCYEKGYDVVYGMYNPNLKGIEKLYLSEGAVHSERYPDLLYFPGFYLNGKLSKFHVIELEKECLQKIASKM